MPTSLIAWALLSLIGPVAVQGADSAKPPGDYRADVAPFIQKYCVECHGAKSPKADVSLHLIRDAAGVMADKATWESVLEMVEFRAMPPEDKPQPSEEERARVVKWLEATLFHVDCTAGRDPGRVTIQRLNRNEYDNTIRDLFGLDLKLSKNFPSDDVGEGFDNIGDVLSLPPLLMEKYLDAAEAVAQAAILVPGAENAPKLVRAGRRLRGTQSASRGDSGFWNMYSSGSVLGEFEAARDGRYLIRIEAMANQAGDEPARMAVRQDDRELQTVDVKAEFDSPEVYEIPLTTKAGSFKIEAAFTNDFYVEGNGNTPTQDRNLYVSRIELIGPLDLDSSALPESHQRIVVSRPEKGKSVRDAASEVLYRFVSRAYRRQATREEVEPFVGLVEAAVKNGESYERGIQIAVAATLVSPQFLFRIEHDPRPNDADTAHALSDYELASRLSYFLWSSMPDTELFSYARAGKLNESETLRRQVKRMLADPKAEALVRNFGGQWLNLRNLDEIQPDPQKFPGVDEKLKQDMRRETEMFFEAVMREDRGILDFLVANFSYLNRRLAEHYGLKDRPNGDEFQRVEFTDGRRGGVLTQASILTLTSNPTRTSPVKRGKWIMENILGTPPPEPPADVPLLEATSESNPNLSLREQMELHRRDPGCASCHRVMDTLGFGFENFDAVGRWRDKDNGAAIDPSGVLPSGESFRGPAELVRTLSQSKDDFARLLTDKMLTYALGRGLEPYDKCAVDEIVKRIADDEYRFSTLVTGIVLSEPFRMRRGEEAKP